MTATNPTDSTGSMSESQATEIMRAAHRDANFQAKLREAVDEQGKRAPVTDSVDRLEALLHDAEA